MTTPSEVLILGASFGSLLGIKLALAGHHVRIVGRTHEVEPINDHGLRVRMPIRSRRSVVELDSRASAGSLSAATPSEVDPRKYDLVALVVQEPQCGHPELRRLLEAVAASGVPCVAVMNMPPLPYLARLPDFDVQGLEGCYRDPSVWRAFKPELFTLCSADPQAFHPLPDRPNLLEVSLATNFKVARFDSEEHTALLSRLQNDIQSIRFHVSGEDLELPVKLKVHDSLFVPLSKWPMLLAGNYRCIVGEDVRSIRDAVHDDIGITREVYEWVAALCRRLGAAPGEQVPFERYAEAARSLVEPASAARALSAGVTHIERVDRLVKTIGARMGMRHPEVDRVVTAVDGWLSVNRTATT